MKKEKRGKRVLAFLFLLFVILFSSSFISAAFSCTTGTTSTDCYLNTTYVAGLNEFINANNLFIGQGGSIINYTSRSSFILNLTGNLSLQGNSNLTAGNISIIANSLTIDLSSRIQTDFLGFNSTQGPGAGANATASYQSGGGAGHGGTGGGSEEYNFKWIRGYGYPGGPAYDNYLAPINFGSGGGYGEGSPSWFGGAGAGIVKINLSDFLIVNGNISSNGGNGTYGGGGSGGSIWIIANNISGSGIIRANGGPGYSGNSKSGGGAGGRIAIYSNYNTFNGIKTAYGGNISNYSDPGAAGTIYLKILSSQYGDLIIDNNNQASYASTRLLSGAHTFNNLSLINNGALEVEDRTVLLNLTNTNIISDGKEYSKLINNGNISFPGNFNLVNLTLANNNGSIITGLINLTIGSFGVLTHTFYTEKKINYRLELTTINFNLSSTGMVKADLAGFPSATGPGAGANATASYQSGGGAGHGGTGGDSEDNYNKWIKGFSFPGGPAYGNYLAPITLGSGGGYGEASAVWYGGIGGGAIKINASGNLIVDGNISVNAGRGTYGGGGSGGSIWLIADNFSGSGSIRANGGDGYYGNSRSGGGAGGRIAIYSNSNAFGGMKTAYGGNVTFAGDSGAAGTIFIKTGARYGDLIVDNNNLGSYSTTRLLSGINTFDNLTLTNNGSLEIEDKSVVLNLTNTNIISDGKDYSKITSNGNITFPANFNLANLTFAINNGSVTSGLINLTIGNLGVLTHTAYLERLIFYKLDINLENLNISNGGAIKTDFGGFYSTKGIGCGANGTTSIGGGGGGYGGTGGDGNYFTSHYIRGLGSNGGIAYGNYLLPIDFGSAGGHGYNTDYPGGTGGGVIKINASGNIIINGNISSNGAVGYATGGEAAGGGSGGSIWLITNTISGSGIIRANGGNGGNAGSGHGGGGSGGRMAIYYSLDNFNGLRSAYGGNTSLYGDAGAAGTIYLKNNNLPFGDLIINNNNYDSFETTRLLSGIHTFNNISLINKGDLEIEDKSVVLNLTNTNITGDGKSFSRITVNGNVTLAPNFNINNWTFAVNNGSNLFQLSNLTIGVGGILTHSAYSERQTFYRLDILLNNLNILQGAFINTDYSGFYSTIGPGTGVNGTTSFGAGGAGYGGTGGDGNNGAWLRGLGRNGGNAYGNYLAPLDIGSGGGHGYSLDYPGGTGGGAIKINVTGNILVNGNISANAGAGFGVGSEAAGGGSAGSIWLISNNVSGSGNIIANGGTGGNSGGGKGGAGSGGRIAIYYNINNFVGTNSAYGGSASVYGDNGPAGTIYFRNINLPFGDLVINNNNLDSFETTRLLSGSHTFNNISLINKGDLEIEDSSASLNLTNTLVSGDGKYLSRITSNGNITFPANFNISNWTLALNNVSTILGLANITITNGGILTHTSFSDRQVPYRLDLILNNINILSGGIISVDSSGFYSTGGQGTGANGTTNNGGAGAGYGGLGSNGNTGRLGGARYGNPFAPIDLGSGGGHGYSLDYPGGSGGGAIKINASGNVIVNGNISSTGGNGYGLNSEFAGGGSGGSIWIITNNISGSGNISANGGLGGTAGGSKSGGGAGGRILIAAINNVFAGNISVIGGNSTNTFMAGAEGTIYTPLMETPGVNFVFPSPIDMGGINKYDLTINTTISINEDKFLNELDYTFGANVSSVYDSFPNLYLGFNNISTLGEIDGRIIDASPDENIFGAGRSYHTVDKFTIKDYANEWNETRIIGDKMVGKSYYILNLTSITGNSIYKNVSDFNTTFNHIEMRYKNYPNGPTTLKLYYTDGRDCRNIGNETCAQDNLFLNNTETWSTLDAEITDPNWIDNDGLVDLLRLNINGASASGLFYIDYLRFYTNVSQNTTPTLIDGRFGKAFSFDGMNNYLEAEQDDSLNMNTKDFSLATWIKLNNTNNNTVISKGNTTDYYSMYINNGYPTFDLKVGNNLLSPPLNSGKVNDGNWHFIVITFTRIGNAVRYIDGLPSGSTFGISANSGLQNNSANLYIGKSNVSNAYFNGTIDEVVIYNRTMTASEINNLYYSNLYKINQTTWVFTRNASGSMTADSLYNYSLIVNDPISSNIYLRKIFLDRVSPNATLITPNNNTYTSQFNTTNLTANLTDDASGLQNASLFINGALNTTITFVQGTLQSTIGIVISFVDGIYNWFYQLFDAAGNIFTTGNNTMTIDTNSPVITFVDPTPADGDGKAGSFYLNTTIYEINLKNATLWFNGTEINCNTTICGDLNNSLVQINSTNWIFSVLRSNLSSATSYNYYAYSNDLAGNKNSTEMRSVIGNRPPSVTNFIRYPIDNNSIKPLSDISFTINISDIDSNFDSALLQWKNSTVDWSYATNVSTINLTTIPFTSDKSIVSGLFNVSFTLPAYQDTIYYRFYSNDSLGDFNYSNEYILVSNWRCSWDVSYSGLSGVEAYGYYTNGKLIGNVTIMNKGDIGYSINNCSIVFSLSYTGFSPDYTSLLGNSNAWNPDGDAIPLQFGLGRSIRVNATSNLTFNVYSSFPSSRLAETPTIKILSDLNDSITGKNNESVPVELTISPPGPYLREGFLTNPTVSYLTTSLNTSLSAYVENVAGNGSEINNAYNVSFNWELPLNFNYEGNTSINYSVINTSNRLYQNLNLSFDPTVLVNINPGVYEFKTNSFGYNSSGGILVDAKNNSFLNSSINISFECYSAAQDGICVLACVNLSANLVIDPDCDIDVVRSIVVTNNLPAAGGGGGGGGASSTATVIKSEANYELLRGGKQNFQLEVKNKYGDEMKNIKILVSGLNSEYISISPSSISSLAPGATRNVTITISAPGYFTGKKYDLIFDITGSLVSNATSGALTQVTDKRYVTLYIVEVDRQDATININESYSLIAEMNASGLITKEVIALLANQNKAYAELNFLEVKNIYDQIKKIRDNAFESKQLIEEITAGIAESEKNGITITESKKSLYLAQVAFNRGDYALALERLKEAKLVYALEVKGELNLIYTIKNNPGKSFGLVVFAGLFGWGSSLLIRLRLYKRKLKNLGEEEVLLLELMKMVQRQCFEEKKLSMEEYDQAMMQYESKLSETIEDKIRTETKIANLLRARGKRKALDQEKARLIELIRKVQDDYLNKNKIETRIYEGMIKSYSSRLTEVDEQLAYVEAQEALKKQQKINRAFKV